MAPSSGEDDLTISERYGLPSAIVQNLGDTPWETIVTMARGIGLRNDGKSPQVRKLQKEISLKRMLLAEMAIEQSKEGKLDPKLLVELVNLLERCEKMAQDYDLDLREFNSFIALLIEKAKKEKMHRHEGAKMRALTHFAPMDEKEMEGLKRMSEGGSRIIGAGRKKGGKK